MEPVMPGGRPSGPRPAVLAVIACLAAPAYYPASAASPPDVQKELGPVEIIPPRGPLTMGPQLDADGPVVPAADPCQKETIDPEARTITILNGCSSAVTIQYLTSAAPKVAGQVDLLAGYSLRAPYFPGAEGFWWVWTSCPRGYRSATALAEENRRIIASGAYRCAKP